MADFGNVQNLPFAFFRIKSKSMCLAGRFDRLSDQEIFPLPSDTLVRLTYTR